jgi:biofilm PGA synthesis N-glycosyltransferase PgaC
MGGCQAILKYAFVLSRWRTRRLWPIYIEYIASVLWAYAMALVIVIWLAGLVVSMPQRWQITLVPGWHGVLIGTTCLAQICVALLLDRKYDRKLFKNIFWMIWYPLAYWMLNLFTTLVAVPKILLRERGRRAVWTSPDRGVRNPRHATKNESEVTAPALRHQEEETCL